MSVNKEAYLAIKGVDISNFKFSSFQLTESIGGVLPKIVATFISGSNDYPFELGEVELTLAYLDYINITFTANVDQIDYGHNDVILYFTCTPAEFYRVSRSASYLSLNDAIESIYWSDNISTDIIDTTPIEFNQVNTTDSKCLFRALSSLSSPSCFSLNINRLKITDLSNPRPTVFIDAKDGVNYKLEGTDNSLKKGKIKDLPYYLSPSTGIDGQSHKSIISWGNKTLHVNSKLNDMISNLIENTKFYDNLNQCIRVTFKYLPEFLSGDIISINLTGIDSTEFLVVERLAIIKSGGEVALSALLKAI